MRPLLIVDLDGPILDVRARYFAAHHRAVGAVGAVGAMHAHADVFWAAKRARIAVDRFLSAGDPCAYADAFRACIEDDDLLALDTLEPEALGALARCAGVVDVHVLSLRTRHEGARRAVVRLGVASVVPVTFVAHGPEGKVPAARALATGRTLVAVVGDTEADAAIARALAVPFVGVACGIRTRQALFAEGASFVGAGLCAAIGHVLARLDDRESC